MNISLWTIDKILDNMEAYLEETGGAFLNEEMEQAFDKALQDKDAVMKKALEVMTENEQDIAGLKFRIEQLTEIKEKKQRTADSMKRLLTYAVEKYGETKIDEFRLGLRKSKSLDSSELENKFQNVVDLFIVTENFEKSLETFRNVVFPKNPPDSKLYDVKLSLVPKKQKIKDAMKEGIVVDGCTIIEKYNLKIS